MIKIAVTGALGRMGTLVIEEIKKCSDMELVAGFDIQGIGKPLLGDVYVASSSDLKETLSLKKPDVLIDFTNASASVGTVSCAAEVGINLVVGTTGLNQDQLASMKKAIEGNVAAVISPNFSIGVNIFWKLLTVAATALKDYDIEVIESHHNQKKDAPSGTALAAVDILKKATGIDDVVYGRVGMSMRKKEIGVHAVRAGDIVGDHTVIFAGPGERIEIKHQAHSRTAFASGAIKAARFVSKAKPGMYSMSEVID
jgi:4-hydroxy-tetrahydrodipicolinate reductase